MLTLYSQLHALEISKASASSGQLTLLEISRLLSAVLIKCNIVFILYLLSLNSHKLVLVFLHNLFFTCATTGYGP